MNQFTGEVRMFAGEAVPTGWALCDGAEVSRTTYPELFAVIGETYGDGDGETTFNLPDMRGRFANGVGPTYDLGQVGGSESATLTVDNLPAHNHVVKPQAVKDDPNAGNPQNNLHANGQFYSSAAADVQMKPAVCELTGGSQPFEILNPYLTLHFIIALE